MTDKNFSPQQANQFYETHQLVRFRKRPTRQQRLFRLRRREQKARDFAENPRMNRRDRIREQHKQNPEQPRPVQGQGPPRALKGPGREEAGPEAPKPESKKAKKREQLIKKLSKGAKK